MKRSLVARTITACVVTWFVIAAALLIGHIIALALDDPKPSFHCNGTSGVYTGPDGRAVINPYDSQCVPQPSFSYQGG